MTGTMIAQHDTPSSSTSSVAAGSADSTMPYLTSPDTARTSPDTARTSPDTASASPDTSSIGPYVPGSIPLPKISLLPPENGKTGQIADKILMPRQLPHLPPGHTQTVPMYNISYPDRPGKRELVPFNEILQHVSLRELERWEDQCPHLRKEQKQQKAKARRQELRKQRQKEKEEGPKTRMVTRATRKRTGEVLLDKLNPSVGKY
ncbi:predicted protein [Chaetomium globosum CBS 148.51]|uniref:Uncharacterized protein n=1 Tax=Chaetomium globosum (strain ATCC 6205 / CBS 148.51 / DSM 1962 / NBRC 6347 / NRRL 1970) TaxID=306901 RepID=Q2GZF2_CHAGB|nr:uncharacterized protein CHGG_05094 [Chaetomium globosum CBS 148.51]EAQ88475.1 predicted protein [Chaetomium globosum CBS 148.51]